MAIQALFRLAYIQNQKIQNWQDTGVKQVLSTWKFNLFEKKDALKNALVRVLMRQILDNEGGKDSLLSNKRKEEVFYLSINVGGATEIDLNKLFLDSAFYYLRPDPWNWKKNWFLLISSLSSISLWLNWPSL